MLFSRALFGLCLCGFLFVARCGATAPTLPQGGPSSSTVSTEKHLIPIKHLEYQVPQDLKEPSVEQFTNSFISNVRDVLGMQARPDLPQAIVPHRAIHVWGKRYFGLQSTLGQKFYLIRHGDEYFFLHSTQSITPFHGKRGRKLMLWNWDPTDQESLKLVRAYETTDIVQNHLAENKYWPEYIVTEHPDINVMFALDRLPSPARIPWP